MSTSSPAALQLADWCARLTWADVPAAVREHVPLRVLDTVGLILAGADTPAVAAARAYAQEQRGSAQATLIGSNDRLPASLAALVHGTAAHCRDFDDTFVDSVVHPGSVVVPTALALAQAHDVAPDEFATAIVAGYEVAARIGAVAARRFHARALHATGVVGPIAAAATAGRMLQLDAERIGWAMGLAASMSGGLMAFIVDGGWSKWLHCGWAAHGGIVAAALASRGFRGPAHVLDGGHDLYAALLHGETVDRTSLTDALGRDWRGDAAQFKYYPCAHVIQPYISALLALRAEHGLGAAAVDAIECTIAPWAAAIVCEPREAKLQFDSELAAIASLPYQLAVAMLDGEVGLHALSEQARNRADVATLASRITHRNDAQLGRTFDGSLTVRTADGRHFSATAITPDIDAAKVRSKFAANAAARLSSVAVARALITIPASIDWRPAAQVLADR